MGYSLFHDRDMQAQEKSDHWSLGARGRDRTPALSPKAFVQAILPPLP